MPPTPQRAEKNWPPVVVGTVHQTGLNLMRDLERRGVRVAGVDFDSEHPGFVSVYGKAFHCPNPDSHPEEWAAFMCDFAKKFDSPPVLIPAADVFVSAIARHAAELEKHYLFSRKDVELQAALATKERQYALAAQHGLPHPRFAYITSKEELKAFAAAATFPCLLKPRHQREWDLLPEDHTLRGRKVIQADTETQLFEFYGLLEELRPEVVAQEVIVGPDDAKYCYLSVYGRDGSRLGHCVVREFCAYPIFFGSASIVQPVLDDDIAQACDSFLRAVNYGGICEIEVKRDTRDGKVRLIEVNPRFSGTGDCAKYAGVATGWLHYLDTIGQRVQPETASRFDFHHITLRRHVPALLKMRAEGMMNWKDALGTFRPPVIYWDFDLRDWRVTVRTLAFCARVIAHRIMRRPAQGERAS